MPQHYDYSSLPLMSLAELTSLSAETKRSPNDLDIFLRWEIPKDDLEARRVDKALKKIWVNWSRAQRERLLKTAEGIGRAERAKQLWNPKASRSQYLRLAKSGTDAARLVKELAVIVPPPWNRDSRPVGQLVTSLLAYVNDVLDVTLVAEKNLAGWVAREQVRDLLRETPKISGRPTWVLLRDLVWLATRMEIEPSVSTIRSYRRHSGTSRTQTPAFSHMKRNWPLINEVFGGPPGERKGPGRFPKPLQDSLA
jgi:hypothetical protein